MAVKLGAGFARATRVGDGEPLVKGHGHNRRLAQERMALQPHFLGVHVPVSLQIIQTAVKTPGPSHERAPNALLSEFSFVHQPDDSASQTGAATRLNTIVVIEAITPAALEKLLSWIVDAATAATARETTAAKSSASETKNHWHWSSRLARRRHGEADIDGNVGVGRIVNMPDYLLGDVFGVGVGRDACHGPRHFGCAFRNVAVDLGMEIVQNFQTALLPPSGLILDHLTVVQH